MSIIRPELIEVIAKQSKKVTKMRKNNALNWYDYGARNYDPQAAPHKLRLFTIHY